LGVYEHFGLSGPPFSVAPDPRFAYPTMPMNLALANIAYSVDEHRGLFLLQGEIGTGKTTLGRFLMHNWQQNTQKYVAASVHDPVATSQAGFLRKILAAFGQPTPRYLDPLHATMLNFLLKNREEGKTVVLLLDEAQTIPAPGFDLLHTLSNHQTIEDQLLQVVMLAQTNIIHKLDQRPALKSRIVGEAYLGPLPIADALAMLRHRMQVVGGDFDAVFRPESHKPVYNATKGIPRELCVLADAALVTAFATGKKAVDCETLDTVFANMRSKGWSSNER
jgi:general secretion pathway protein A